MMKLVFASLLLLGFSSVAAARSLPAPVFEIEKRNKVDHAEPEWSFTLHANGTWRYMKTVGQAIKASKAGKLSTAQMQKIRKLLRTSWQVSQADVTCMAFAASYVEYSVSGRAVWKDEMCSGAILDRGSQNRLGQVLAIVNPLM